MKTKLLALLLGGMIIAIVVAACVPAQPTVEPEPTSDPEGRALVLGDISDDPGEVIDGTQPLADYLAERLDDYGIVEGHVRVVATADEMAQLLERGEVDIYFDSVYPATLISDETGALPFLRRWRFGMEEYHTIIFTKPDNGIETIQDLNGMMVAFDNPFSTSGYVLPAVYLVNEGMTLTGKESRGDSVAADEIGFVFSYDDENTLQWVLDDLVAAGATDNGTWQFVLPDEIRDQLVILAETESIPRQVAVARPDMDEDLLVAVTEILLHAHEDDAGQAALDAFQTEKFDEFPEGIEQAQERMREMMELVQDIPAP